MNGDLSYFRLYAAEFLADEKTGEMTATEAGALLFLWCREWVNGSIPSDEATLLRMAHLRNDQTNDLRNALRLFKASTSEADRLLSPRLEHERGEAEGAKDKKIRAGRAGGRASGEARRKHRLKQNEANTKPIQPSFPPTSLPTSQQQPGGGCPEALLPDPEAALRRVADRIGEELGAPAPKLGREPERTVASFSRWLLAVGEDDTVAECVRLAREQGVVPSSLGWWPGWLDTVPDERLAGGAA